jgi:hypothetical protein
MTVTRLQINKSHIAIRVGILPYKPQMLLMRVTRLQINKSHIAIRVGILPYKPQKLLMTITHLQIIGRGRGLVLKAA